MVPDPSEPSAVRSVDPGNDYLLALSTSSRAVLVSGDDHLLRLRPDVPVPSAPELLAALLQR